MRYCDNGAGFTLLELLTTLAIFTVLVAIAVPSFTWLVASNQSSSACNAMVAVLTYARSEAISRNRPIAVCRSEDGVQCSRSPASGWEVGAITFAFNDTDGSQSYTNGDSIHKLLRVDVPLFEGAQIMGQDSVTKNSISFNAYGRGPVGTLGVTPAADSTYRKTVILHFGRPRIGRA